MKRRYGAAGASLPPNVWTYLSGAASARAGDEMSGPAVLLLGFAVTGRPATGSALLAAMTIAGAAGGPAFGAVLDRSRRPERVLAATLAAYALGIAAVQAAVGRLPMPAVLVVALTAGLFSPAVAGGWTSQLPRLVTGPALVRGSALDAMSYSAASLAGPSLAALVAAGLSPAAAVLTAAGLTALAVPAALALGRHPAGTATTAEQAPAGRLAPHRQVAAGFAAIARRRPLLRATVTSVVSYAGIGMLLVCCPVLGAGRLGGSSRGALLISAAAAASLGVNALLARWPRRGAPDPMVFGSTLVIGAGMAAAAVAPGWLTLAAAALSGAGEGPQLTALFAVRHREAPGHMRGQIFTTAASLKIAGMSAGAALAGPLAGHSVVTCLLVAAGFELAAAAAYLLAAGPAAARTGAAAGDPARSGEQGLSLLSF